jgi:hypothetical protein
VSAAVTVTSFTGTEVLSRSFRNTFRKHQKKILVLFALERIKLAKILCLLFWSPCFQTYAPVSSTYVILRRRMHFIRHNTRIPRQRAGLYSLTFIQWPFWYYFFMQNKLQFTILTSWYTNAHIMTTKRRPTFSSAVVESNSEQWILAAGYHMRAAR